MIITKPNLESQLQNQENYLQQLITYLDIQIKNLPEGRIRIQQRPGNVDYYWCNIKQAADYHGIYISRKNKDLIFSLAQKSYYEKLRKIAVAMLIAIQKCQSSYHESDLTDIYYSLSIERQKLIHPLFLSDEDYALQWRNVQYEKKEDFNEDSNLYSMRGERMRSKSEIMLAGLFDKYDIPYRYEYPIQINSKTIYPDFFVLNKRTRKEYIWEHFGMLGTEKYADNFVMKIDSYTKNGYIQGINAIYTFESDNWTMSMEAYEILIKNYLL